MLLLFALGFESSGRSKMSGSGSTPTKACSCSSKREKPELRASDIVEWAAAVSKRGSAILTGAPNENTSSKPLKHSIVKRTLVFKR